MQGLDIPRLRSRKLSGFSCLFVKILVTIFVSDAFLEFWKLLFWFMVMQSIWIFCKNEVYILEEKAWFIAYKDFLL
jgi:hypothetical protein